MNHQDHPALSLFSQLLAVPSPSGWETALAAVVRKQVTDLGYDVESDQAGNLLVRLPGRAAGGPVVCYAAHMDEIAAVVQRIEPDGTLRLIRSGGLFPWKLGETPLVIMGDERSIDGVLSMGAGHGAGQRTIEWEDVRVLTGLAPAQLAAAGVRPGTPVVPSRSICGPIIFGDEADPLVGAWTFDDRMGVVTLLRLLRFLRETGEQPMQPALIAFTVCEEVGGMGAKVLAARERPDLFIAIDGCPMTPGAPLELDGRPGIWTTDRLAPYDPRLVQDLCAAARAAGTELQPVAYDVSASDASMVYAAGLAPRAACFGQVRQNSHGFEVARLSVFDNMLHTLVHFVTNWGV
ncbi:MAG: M20/M25/M40 family metallo-hydrolase [Caldilineaceae bacterium]|nr:M20/M25/M40 family metallo-hydrolase [Caldilineaceae bacterium]